MSSSLIIRRVYELWITLLEFLFPNSTPKNLNFMWVCGYMAGEEKKFLKHLQATTTTHSHQPKQAAKSTYSLSQLPLTKTTHQYALSHIPSPLSLYFFYCSSSTFSSSTSPWPRNNHIHIPNYTHPSLPLAAFALLYMTWIPLVTSFQPNTLLLFQKGSILEILIYSSPKTPLLSFLARLTFPRASLSMSNLVIFHHHYQSLLLPFSGSKTPNSGTLLLLYHPLQKLKVKKNIKRVSNSMYITNSSNM